MINKICKVKPDRNHCYSCIDRQLDSDTFKDCDLCILNQPDSELLSVGVSCFGKDYAFVLMDGVIKRVSLDRVRHIGDKKGGDIEC